MKKSIQIILTSSLGVILSTTVVVPIVIFNKDKSTIKKEIEKQNIDYVYEYLNKTSSDKKSIILKPELRGKIIANNNIKEKIIEKVKNLVKDKKKLLNVEMDIEMEKDSELSIEEKNISIILKNNKQNKLIVKNFIVKYENSEKSKNIEKALKIKNKISYKNIIIPKNVDVSTNAKILAAIKTQLKIDNPTLTNEDLSKITDNIDSLTLGKNTIVNLSITIGQKDNEIVENIEINVLKGKTYKELNTEKVATIKAKIQDTILIIDKDVDTSDDAKILAAIKVQLKIDNPTLSNDDLDKITDNISSLTPGVNTNVILKISVGNGIDVITDTININITRFKSEIEINKSKVSTIKAKIQDTILIIDKDVDTSDDAKILAAIKAQLKIDNPSLIDEDLAKITDNISSLTPGENTNVILKISVGLNQKLVFDSIKVNIIKELTKNKKIENIKNKIINTNLTIGKNVDTSDDAKILAAIKAQLKIENPLLTVDDLAKITDDIDSLKVSTFTEVALTITIDSNQSKIKIIIFKPYKDNELIKKIKDKITDKNLTIDKNVDTSDDAKILAAIKAQLKIENPSLIDEDLAKITDNISSLTPGINTNVALTITVDSENYTINITINRPLSDDESIEVVKNAINNLNIKEILIDEIVGTIGDNKNSILTNLKNLNGFNAINLNGVIISIISSTQPITLNGIPFTITLTKNLSNQKITTGFTVKRSKNNLEKLTSIKNKIIDTNLTIGKNVDTSDDAKILAAIKAQLKIENPLLKDDDLAKITDNITSLTSGVNTNVTLTITAGNETDTIKITINRSSTDAEKINIIKDKIVNKNLSIDKDVDTSDDAKILAAIKAQLKIENPLLIDEDLAKITDNISSLTPGINTNVTLTITINSENDTINITINRPLSDTESVKATKNAINALATKTFLISATSGDITTNKTAILTGLQSLSGYSTIDLNSVIISIENSSANLTLAGIPFTIVLTKGSVTEKITSGFTVKKNKNIDEINKDKIAAIKAKITNTNLTINKNANISNDASILAAIKAQLQIDNPSLIDDDLDKITDNISSLIIGQNTNVKLTITIGNQTGNIDITINKVLSDAEVIINVINSLKNLSTKTFLISATSGDITTNKNAILTGLQNLSGYSSIDLNGVNISIQDSSASLTLAGINFNLIIKKDLIKKIYVSNFKVKRSFTNSEKVANIKAKIQDVDLTIDKDVDTSNDAKILAAIKAQLKIENPSLIDEDLAKITDNISSLTPGINTNVALTITVDSENDTINITINRPLSDAESVKAAKNAINALATKTFLINATSGDITTNKAAILTGLQSLSGYSTIDLNSVTISIENSSANLTLAGIPFTIVLTKGSATEKITSGFTVKRSKNIVEINKDKIAAIKAKITNINLTIDQNDDTSDDAKILAAIKAQLKIENASLIDDDLDKITDNINSLTPGQDTNVTLTITINSQTDTINVNVLKLKSDLDIVNKIKNSINSLATKEFTISVTPGDITTNKAAILAGLQSLSGYSNINLRKVIISIEDSSANLTLAGISFTIILTKGNVTEKITSGFTVKRTKPDSEIINEVKNSINALVTKEFTISATSGDITTNKAAILAGLQSLNGYSTIDLNSVIISIENSSANLTPTGISFTIILTKGSATEKITSGFTVKRTKPDSEIVSDIKAKITNTDLTIGSNIDTTTVLNLHNSIKNELQNQNSTLSSNDLLKITTSASSITYNNNWNNITLTITIGKASDNVNIRVRQNASVGIKLQKTINAVANKEFYLLENEPTDDDNFEDAIKEILKNKYGFSEQNANKLDSINPERIRHGDHTLKFVTLNFSDSGFRKNVVVKVVQGYDRSNRNSLHWDFPRNFITTRVDPILKNGSIEILWSDVNQWNGQSINKYKGFFQLIIDRIIELSIFNQKEKDYLNYLLSESSWKSHNKPKNGGLKFAKGMSPFVVKMGFGNGDSRYDYNKYAYNDTFTIKLVDSYS